MADNWNSVEMLEAIQRDNPETFSAQYLNRPIAAGKEEFTEAMLLGATIAKDPNMRLGARPSCSWTWQAARKVQPTTPSLYVPAKSAGQPLFATSEADSGPPFRLPTTFWRWPWSTAPSGY
jgi:hypothetical protein